MAFYKEDIADIELNNGTIHRAFMNKTIGEGDALANWFGVRLYRDGEPVSAEDAAVTGLFMAPDGTRYVINETSYPGSTSKSGNVAKVRLPGVCYAVDGQFCLAIKLSSGSVNGTMRIVDGVVSETGEAGAVVPTSTIPATADIIAAYEEAVELIGSVVRFDASQSLSDAEKTTARGNIGAASASDLSDAQDDITDIQGDITDIETAIAGLPALNDLIMNRMIRFPNFSTNAVYALEATFDSTQAQYTVTALKAFSVVGFSMTDNLVRIGYNVENADYPMPASFSSDTSMGYNFAFLCFDLTDNTAATWQIVKYADFVADQNLCPICVLYRGQSYFYDDNLKILFKNSVTEDAFLNNENSRIAQSAFYKTALCNATALIAGKADYVPAEYKITFTGAIMGPVAGVGSFDQSIRLNTVVVDWSEEEHPEYVRFIYFDTQEQEMVAYCSTILTADDRYQLRLRKNLLALVCVVYQGTFVYTCGACTPGKWFVNGNDIYAGSSDAFKADLFNAFKKVGVIGDSLSVGYMYNKTTGVATSRMLAYSWVKKVMNDAGAPWLNLGTSGQSVLTWCSNATYGKVQAEASGNKCQAYIIGLGENDQSDSARGIPLGEPSDIVDDYTQVATTYYGGYARIIQILKHLNPDCKIFCLTNPRTGGNARAEYNVAVRYIAGTYYDADDNVFLIDLANDDGTLFNGGTFLPVDAATITGGHYSAVGYSRIATIMENAIMKAIQANQTHFVDVAYIPYDTNDPTPNTMTE